MSAVTRKCHQGKQNLITLSHRPALKLRSNRNQFLGGFLDREVEMELPMIQTETHYFAKMYYNDVHQNKELGAGRWIRVIDS